jgi:glucosylceramidase
MKEWIEAGVHIYSAWNMVLDPGGFNLDLSRPWPQNALIVADGTTYKTTSYYNVFRHLAQYVYPDAVRVDVTGDALAFKNADGSVVTIMHNPGGTEAATTLSVDGTMLQFSIPASGWATVTWGG